MMKSVKLCYCQTAGKYSLLACVHHFAAYACVWSVPLQCSISNWYFGGFFDCLNIIINSHCMYSLLSWPIFHLDRVDVSKQKC